MARIFSLATIQVNFVVKLDKAAQIDLNVIIKILPSTYTITAISWLRL